MSEKEHLFSGSSFIWNCSTICLLAAFLLTYLTALDPFANSKVRNVVLRLVPPVGVVVVVALTELALVPAFKDFYRGWGIQDNGLSLTAFIMWYIPSGTVTSVVALAWLTDAYFYIRRKILNQAPNSNALLATYLACGGLYIVVSSAATILPFLGLA